MTPEEIGSEPSDEKKGRVSKIKGGLKKLARLLTSDDARDREIAEDATDTLIERGGSLDELSDVLDELDPPEGDK